MANFKIIGLFHDLISRRSSVTVQWEGNPDRKLILTVPFGCSLDDLKGEAEKAIKALAKEIDGMAVKE